MDKLRKQLKLAKFGKMFFFGLSVASICLAASTPFIALAGLGSLPVTLFGVGVISLIPSTIAEYVFRDKEENLESKLNSSINDITESEVKFQTAEYTTIKEDKKEIIVMSPKKIGLDDSKTNNSELEK